MARTELNSSAIPSGTVVSSDLTFPLTDFSSTGIDDNASNTAITINANGSITIAQDILNYVTEAPSDSEQYARINGTWAQVAGGIEYTVSTSNVTAVADQGIIADTSAGAFTVTLPASPSAGDKVFIADGGDWSNNYLTVARNGSTIEDANTDFTMDYGGVNVGFIYDGSTWQVYPQAGLLGLRGIDDNALSTAITISSTGDTTLDGNFTMTSTDAGSAAAPEIDLFRNSASPADADYLGQIKFTGKQDGGGTVNYAKITGKILDASDGTEDGILEFMLRKAGSNNIAARFRSDRLDLINGTNLTVSDGDAGIGTNSPGARLHVLEVGTGNGEGDLIIATASDGGNAGLRFRTGSSDRFSITTIGSAGSESLRIRDVNNNVERMRITPAGIFSINEDSPYESVKLHVNGSIKAGAREALYTTYDSAITWVKIYERHYVASSFAYGQHNILVTQSGSTNGHGSAARIHINTKQQSTTDNFDIQYVECSGDYYTEVAYYYDSTGGDSSEGLLTIWAKKSAQYTQMSVTSDASGYSLKTAGGEIMAVDTMTPTQPANSTLLSPSLRLLTNGRVYINEGQGTTLGGFGVESVGGMNIYPDAGFVAINADTSNHALYVAKTSTATAGYINFATNGNTRGAIVEEGANIGIRFGSTATSAHTLDDYEEGTWTPTATTYSGTMTIYNARYTRIGQHVTVHGYFRWPSNNQNNDSNQFFMGGLPYTVAASNHYTAGTIGYTGGVDMTDAYLLALTNSTSFYFTKTTPSVNFTNAEIHTRSFGGQFIFSMSYITDA